MSRRSTGLLVLSTLLAGGILLAWQIWLPVHASLRSRLVAALQQHFKSDVQLASFQVALFPRVKASGTGLIIQKPHVAVTPLLAIESFEIETTLFDLVRRSLRLRTVKVKGLQMHIPPSGQRSGGSISMDKVTRSSLLIDDLVSDEGNLVIEANKPGRPPLIFHIHRLRLQNFAFNRATSFDTTLINPVPPGEVVARGWFGPWDPDEPRATPLAGEYTFDDADLGAFEGLAGHLSSIGSFKGTLEKLLVSGTSTTPDFQLTQTGQPVRLDAAFETEVDGTNGDTILNRVTATLVKTTIEAKGHIVKVDDSAKGRLIEMDVRIGGGRLQDIVKLAVKRDPVPMTGTLDLHARMMLPPGRAEVIDRLVLNGTFTVRAGQFSSSRVQQKIGDLSRRGRGHPEEPVSQDVFSDLGSSFRLEKGLLTLPNLTFAVEGARVDLSGTYALRAERLNFTGTLRLKAKPSQTLTGLKSALLRLADPLLKGKNAGTELPIHVRGTVEQPEFGADLRKALFSR